MPSQFTSAFGFPVDCASALTWWAYPDCWRLSPSAWQAIDDGMYPAPPPPVPPTAPSTDQALAAGSDPAAAAALIQQQIDAGWAATQAQNQGFFANLDSNLQAAGASSNTLPWWVIPAFIVAGGLLVLEAVKR